MSFNKNSLKILFVSTEVNPYSKSGGLGDVAGSLPKALRDLGVDMRVALPKYASIPQKYLDEAKNISSFDVHLSWRVQQASVHALDAHGDGESVYFVENDFYFNRNTFYGYGDDYERFAFFTKASLEMLTHINFQPDIVHFNDWHTGLGPTYLRDVYKGFTYYTNMKSLFTIHNLHYQGVFGREVLWAVGLNDGYFTGGDLEFFQNISYLKAGIMHADAVTTVSQTYANEIQTPAYGYGMDGLLRQRAEQTGQIYGITNGIDVIDNDPETDPRIFANFNKDSLEKKRSNKYRLQEDLGLPVSKAPMFSMITRLVEQKGFDILSIILDEFLSQDVQLVILGTGEGRYENLFRHYQWRYPNKVSANITFSGELAQRIYAASDVFMMPSVYEPCGLGQLFAMRYGTIPLVRKTGGLADTVFPFDAEKGTGNGFVFEDYVASGLMWAIRQAIDTYHSDSWKIIMQNAMSGEYSWGVAAKEYIDMYLEVKGK
ncbi:MAG: glycogen synthase [Defluviitaleaceae bacterium]|nr:glycogen synthase [Defluviitaleaceae bacterium]